MARPRLALLALALAGLGALLALLRPWETSLERLARRAPRTGVKVLLVGIDGASFRVLDPLLAAGRLPTFAALRARGASGVLRSENPMISPALWTTIATGRPRREHGITGFLVPEPGRRRGRLVSSDDRATLALWNLASALGRSVGFFGWWATWPAEPVNGWMVSDRMTRERWVEFAAGGQEDRLTFPEALAGELRPLVVDPLALPMAAVDRLVALDAAERAELAAATRPLFGHGLSVFKFAFASQLSYERMALHLLGRRQPDLAGVFLVANDPVSHTFWHYYEPEAYPGVEPRRAARLGRLVPALAEHNDSYLEELLGRLDPATVVIVVSDHGFQASGKLPLEKPPPEGFTAAAAAGAAAPELIAVGQSGKHHLDGLFMAAGGPIRPGVRVEATLYDVAPTVLALLGLPVPADLPGRVLEEAIDPAFLARHPVRRIDSYETLVDRAALRSGAPSLRTGRGQAGAAALAGLHPMSPPRHRENCLARLLPFRPSDDPRQGSWRERHGGLRCGSCPPQP